jgi:hypothetical protein
MMLFANGPSMTRAEIRMMITGRDIVRIMQRYATLSNSREIEKCFRQESVAAAILLQAVIDPATQIRSISCR